MTGGRREFQIGSCLGRGGFGEVYRATMRSAGGLEQVVAVKILRSDIDPASDAVRRLRDEGRVLARLAHPTILRVIDLVLLDGRVAQVTEYVEGADLDACQRGADPLTPRANAQAVGRVAAALSAAWQATGPAGRPLRLVHRDIKPGNVRLGPHAQVKLLDFGIAWSQAADREARTASDVIVGSLHWMAPERFSSTEARPAWDVFGLGVLLYEGGAGERFLPGTMPEVARLCLDRSRWEAHRDERLGLLAGRAAGPLVELVAELLVWDPGARPSAERLAGWCEDASDLLGGAGLRRWSRERTWSSAPDLEGRLEGRTLSEGSLPLSRIGHPEGTPRVVREPVPTADLDRASPPGPGSKRPVAPAPQASDATTEPRGGEPAGSETPTVPVEAPPTPERSFATVAEKPRQTGGRGWVWVGAALLAGGLVLLALIAAAAAVGWWLLPG